MAHILNGLDLDLTFFRHKKEVESAIQRMLNLMINVFFIIKFVWCFYFISI